MRMMQRIYVYRASQAYTAKLKEPAFSLIENLPYCFPAPGILRNLCRPSSCPALVLALSYLPFSLSHEHCAALVSLLVLPQKPELYLGLSMALMAFHVSVTFHHLLELYTYTQDSPPRKLEHRPHAQRRRSHQP